METKTKSTIAGRLTCQVCQEAFADRLDADVHKTTAHDLGRGRPARTRKFLACSKCDERVFVGERCTCGEVREIPAWAQR
jgi:hypothetical protein